MFPNTLTVVDILYGTLQSLVGIASMQTSNILHSVWLRYERPIMLGNNLDLVPNIKTSSKKKKKLGFPKILRILHRTYLLFQ